MSQPLLASDSTAKYYNGDKLMSLLDLNGRKPELFICNGNRLGGKTTYHNSRAMKKLLRRQYRSIGILCRYKYELETLYEQFYEPIQFLYPDLDIKQGRVKDMGYNTLIMDERIIAYGLCLNSADKIKKISNTFNTVDAILWDEYQSSIGDYLPDEASKIISVHDSVARGGGEQMRYVPIIATSNAITLLNPLLSNTDIPSRLMPQMKFLRGNGYVLEQNVNLDALEAANQSGLHRAMGLQDNNEHYLKYEMDNLENVQKMHGAGKYLCTIRYQGEEFAIRRMEDRCMYCSERVDKTHKVNYTTDKRDMTSVFTVTPTVESYRRHYMQGKVYFSSLKARAAFIDFIKY